MGLSASFVKRTWTTKQGDDLPAKGAVQCRMRTVYIIGGKDDLPPTAPKKRNLRGSSRYTVKCRGLTDEERSELERELDRRFQLVPIARRNPTLPSVNWHEVSDIALVVGGAVGQRLLNLLESFVKVRLAKGKEQKLIELYGPDDEVVKRF